MTKSERDKIIKAGKFEGVSLDTGFAKPIEIKKVKGKLVLYFEENHKRFPIPLTGKFGQEIQKAHRKFRLTELLRLEEARFYKHG